MYGKGVFTTVRITDGRPFLWDKHWRRLSENAEAVGISLAGHNAANTLATLGEVIKINGVEQGRARITFFDRTLSRVWSGGAPTRSDTGMLVVTGDHRPHPGSLRLTNSPFTVNSCSPLAGVKSCNYLEHLLAAEDAKDQGFDEAVRINETFKITSACMANIFWIVDGSVFTPSLETGCLAGTTRELVLENIECEEVRAELNVLYEADTIFLTSAGLGISAVGEFDGQRLAPLPDQLTKLVP